MANHDSSQPHGWMTNRSSETENSYSGFLSIDRLASPGYLGRILIRGLVLL